ncbi:MAG TPA: DUF934 domain-containing protein [Verrucomicrobiae bacterium]|nr:DUF934 domain-containing protein [Verrucomicrobiae bacterium]
MGKQIIRDRRIVMDDWSHVEDEAALPSSGKIIVSHTRWQADKATLAKRGDVGISIPPTLDVATLAPDLPSLALIALPFNFIQPKPEGGRTFDGRSYSQARLLRERFGYKGEIRAIGDIFRDSMHYAWRCGVNAFELAAGRDLDDALKGFDDFSTHYQAAADDPTPIFRRRKA